MGGLKPIDQSEQRIDEEKAKHNQYVDVNTIAVDACEHTDLHAIDAHPKNPLLPIAM